MQRLEKHVGVYQKVKLGADAAEVLVGFCRLALDLRSDPRVRVDLKA